MIVKSLSRTELKTLGNLEIKEKISSFLNTKTFLYLKSFCIFVIVGELFTYIKWVFSFY